MKKRIITALLLIVVTLITSIPLSGCSNDNKSIRYITSADELSEAKIGVQTGTVYDVMAKEAFPDCTVEYYNQNSDILGALDVGKVSAYVCDESVAYSVIRNNNSYGILSVLTEDTYAFTFPKNAERSNDLCEQMNKFIAKIESNGTLEELRGIWSGADETKKDVDYNILTGENGVLRLAVSSEGTEPFVYVKNNKIIGYEMDIATRFCQEYGYGLEITDYTFDGLLAAISSGKADFGAGAISITDERKESMLYSDPDYASKVVTVVKVPKALYSSIDDLKGTRAGVTTGGISDQIIQKNIEDVKFEYLNSTSEIVTALDANKIDFYVINEPTAIYVTAQNHNQVILGSLMDDHYGVIFPKNAEKSSLLCDQMNEFIAAHKADGTLELMIAKWCDPKIAADLNIEYDDLTAENGTLTYAMSSSYGAPFSYIQNGKFAGFETNIAVEFCREYGYGIKFFDTTFPGMIAAVSSGKCDFGSSGISITDERKEAMLFSEPTCDGGMSVVVRRSDTATQTSKFITSVDQLDGKRIAVITGTIEDQLAEKMYPNSPIEYVNSATDLAIAIESGKADYYMMDEPICKYLVGQYPNHTILAMVQDDHYGTIFPKGVEKSTVLCNQMNEFIKNHKADGTWDGFIDRWLGPDADEQTVDYDDLPATNGTLNYALSTSNGAPFAYVKDGKYAGYEVNIAVEFCREYGYGIKFFDSTFAGMIAAVTSGRCDFGSTGISITEERKESLLFSDPTYDGGIVVVVKKADAVSGSDTSFFESIGESFEKTFIREHRWKMFLSGIGVTLLITILSTIFGSVIGFAVFLLYRKGYKVFVVIMDGIGYVIEKLPTVVILMILYYLIFGQLDISNMLVSVIGFTLLFTFSVLGLLKVSVGAIDNGQTEASLALGYTDNQTFLKIIFPQAVKHFIPGYKGAIVSLIKDTAIVGYIAVQDLTKISDIVRSRTYEAFFPLIATAVIYFVLAVMLIFIVKRIQLGTDPRRRKPEKIIKGVERK